MTGKIITVAQQKGGAGKTTITAHLAVALAQKGHKVALVDIDPQGSLSRWFEAREIAHPDSTKIVHAQVSGWRVPQVVEKLAAVNDIVILDSPPHIETEARIAILEADLIVVPVQPSPMDMWATQPTLDLAREKNVPVLLVLNRMPPRGLLAEVVVADMPKLGAPVAETQIGNRISFAAALVDGSSVTETARNSRAAQEINSLAGEILQRLKMKSTKTR